MLLLLLILCGDVHPNPGPPNPEPTHSISIVHNNICSLQQKVPYVEAELTNFDIITLSETWLHDQFPKEKLDIKGYQPIIRLDRSDSAHGGVAIYVRDNLYCKHRPDLNVPYLEAVWIETKLNQEPLLVGCFYKSTRELVSYFDLIDESIRLALSTRHKVIILGGFNSDCLGNTHRHIHNEHE